MRVSVLLVGLCGLATATAFARSVVPPTNRAVNDDVSIIDSGSDNDSNIDASTTLPAKETGSHAHLAIRAEWDLKSEALYIISLNDYKAAGWSFGNAEETLMTGIKEQGLDPAEVAFWYKYLNGATDLFGQVKYPSDELVEKAKKVVYEADPSTVNHDDQPSILTCSVEIGSSTTSTSLVWHDHGPDSYEESLAPCRSRSLGMMERWSEG
ncbi:Uu.00g110560.m01.CDS01 [Anthostomella pinea]|uniref:Uu.00g110560.m01.CDS01 n=1 Tax=Anthostomella pinea TaxID=933095 RepID=A0AAI8VEY1_9PEZI|nr:Uu.00g110560.m01.CDS01 [Anthostomella pinea]